MKRALEQGVDVSEAVKSFNARPFTWGHSAAPLDPVTARQSFERGGFTCKTDLIH